MKRTLIALAVTAAVAAPMVAQAAPKVYGRLNLSVEQYELNYDTANTVTPSTGVNFLDQEYSRLTSNASRFGVKGEDELTATLSAVYQIEWGVSADGDNGDLSQRNRYLGIKSQDLGTLKLGKYDTYTKLAQGEIDLFNDFFGDMEYVIAGENRINNVIGYESPKFFDALTVNVMTQTQDTAQGSATTSAKVKNGSSASVVYNHEELGLYVALAADHGIDSKTALFGTRESDNLRFVASYKIADLTVNGIYQRSDAAYNAKATDPVVAYKTYAGGEDGREEGWQLGASYKIGDELIKVQYGEAERDEDVTDEGFANNATVANKHTQWSVGVDHNFSSKTKAFVWYTVQEEEGLKDANPAAAVLVAKGDYEATVLAIGLDHKF